MDPKLLLKMLLQRRRTTIPISISRGVHRWPLCFAIRHAVNAKSVVKLLVSYGEFCLCAQNTCVARPKCKVTNFTLIPTITRMYHRAFWPILHGIPCVAFPEISWAPLWRYLGVHSRYLWGTWGTFQAPPRYPPIPNPRPWPNLANWH